MDQRFWVFEGTTAGDDSNDCNSPVLLPFSPRDHLEFKRHIFSGFSHLTPRGFINQYSEANHLEIIYYFLKPENL